MIDRTSGDDKNYVSRDRSFNAAFDLCAQSVHSFDALSNVTNQ